MIIKNKKGLLLEIDSIGISNNIKVLWLHWGNNPNDSVMYEFDNEDQIKETIYKLNDLLTEQLIIN